MTTAPCIDCGFETVPDIGKCEWYMVHDAVWFAAGMPKRPIGYEGDWLCIGCLERRLDRMLSRAISNTLIATTTNAIPIV